MPSRSVDLAARALGVRAATEMRAEAVADFNFWDESFHRCSVAVMHNSIVMVIHEAFAVARKRQSWMRKKRHTMDREKCK